MWDGQTSGEVPISIHTLRVEGDGSWLRTGLRGSISIHTLRVEGDVPLSTLSTRHPNFNPHPPRGG